MAKTQTAVVIRSGGGLDVLQVEHDYPVKERKPGEVLVKLTSTSVNPVDLYVREGKGNYATPYPKVLGGDVAGVVVEAGSTSRFKTGDKVWALTDAFIGASEGTYLQYQSVPEKWLAKFPDTIPADEAGGVPLVALTAWQAIKSSDPQPGQRLLVTAAAGGVGHLAVQLGKALGLYVVGSAGPDNQAFVQELGADEVHNYRETPLEDLYAHNPFDIVLDVVGEEAAVRSYHKVLKKSGTHAHVYNRDSPHALIAELKAAAGTGETARVTQTLVKPDGAALEEIAELFADGKVKLTVAEKFPLSEVKAAHAKVATWRTRGKVVLVPPP